MVFQIKQALAPPIFADDEAKTLAARLLNLVLLMIPVGLTAIGLFQFMLLGGRVPNGLLLLLMIGLTIGLRWFMYRGHIQLASLAVTGALWLVVIASVLNGAGVLTVGYVGFLTVVLASGLLLGGRAAVGYASLSALVGLGLVYLEAQQLIPPSFHTPLTTWFNETVYIIFGTMVLYLASRSINTALQQMRHEMAQRRQVENFLRQSEAKYRTLFESASDAIFLMEGERFVDCNTRTLSMFGCERQQIIGQTPMRFSPAHQADGRTSDENGREKIQQALAGAPQFFEWRHCRYDDTLFEAEVSLNRINLDSGPFLLAIVRDVTERHRAEAEKARLLYDLNERVKELTALHATMRVLQQNHGAPAELLQQIVALLPAAWQYPAITAARITLAGTEAATENFASTPWSQHAEFVTAQGESGAIDVVYLEEKPPAAEGPFLAEERHLINSLAEMLHSHFEGRQAETALRQNEERLRLMIEHMPVMVDALDATGQIVLWNRECERVTGYSAAEIIGQPNALEKLYPDADYRHQMLAEWQARGNNYVGWAWELTAKDGTARTIEWSNISDLIPLLNWPTWGIGIDMTERRRAEAAVQRYAARMEILHEIDRAILAAHSPEETALAALTRIRRLVPCRRASVSLFDFHAQEARLLAVSVNGQTHLSQGRGITLEAFGLPAIENLRQGQPYMIEDLPAQPDSTREDQLYIAQGIVAWLTVPLFFQGELIGALNLGRERPGPFSAEDIQVTREVADQLSISLQQARLFEDTQRRVQELAGLHEIAQTFNTLTDARETYGALVEHLAKLIGARRGLVMLSNEQGILLAQPPGYGLPAEWFRLGETLSRLLPRGWGVAPSDVWLANSLKDFPEALQALFQAHQISNALAVPLLIEHTLLGCVVILDKPGEFTADDARLLGVAAAQAAVVIHNAQLYEAEHAARLQTDTLLAVGRTVSSTLSLREVLLRILEQCARLLPYVSGSITVYEHGQPTLMALAGHAGREDVIIRDTYEALSDSPLLRRLLSQPSPLLISNVDDDPDWVKYPATAYIRSWLGVPLIAHEQMMGILSLDGDRPQAFTAQHIAAAQALATQAAIAIDNAQRFTAEQVAREQADVLRAASVAITQSLDLGQVLDSVLEYLHRLVPYDSASVFLIENTKLTVHAARGYEQWAAQAEHFHEVTLDSTTMPILRSLLTTQTSLMIPDTQAHPDWVPHPVSAHVRNWIGVPLIASGQVIGVYSLDKATPHFFTATHVRLAEVLSAQGVAAIQNARLFEAEQRSAARMEILHEIDRAILAAHSPEETAQAALSRIRSLVTCRRASVTLFDFKNQTASLLAVSLNDTPLSTIGPRTSLEAFGWPIIDDLKQGRPHLIENVLSTPALSALDQQFLEQGLRAWLSVPLRYHGELIGALNLARDEPGAFKPEHITIATEIADQLAIAIQQARLLVDTAEALAREERQNEVAQTISSTLDLPTVLEKVVHLVVELVGADAGILGLVTPDGEYIDAPYSFNMPPKLRQVRWVLPRGQGIAWQIVTTGRSLLLPNYGAHPNALPEWIEAGVRGCIGIPLAAGDTNLGAAVVLRVTSLEPFTERDLALAEAVGRQAGVAIQNARLFEAEHRRVDLLTVLHEIGLDLSAQLDLPKLLGTILKRMERLLATPWVAVYFLQPDGQTLEQAAALPNEYREPNGAVRLGEGLVGQVAQTGESLFVGDYSEWPDRVTTLRPPIRAMAGVPIQWQGQVVGVIVAGDERPNQYNAQTVETLQLVATQATVAIQNARLFEQVNSGREQLQALSRQLVEVQEDERRHLARELHDEVGQMLTGLKLMLGVVPRLPPEKIGGQINEVLTVLNRLTERVHDLSLDLRPMMLDDLGLTSALLWLFDRFTSQTGVRVNFEAVGLEERLPPEVETTTYRLIQEALTNVARYAEVAEALIRLRADGAQLRLQIQDAGRGFEVATVLAAGQRVGLAGMKERAALLGGWLRIESAAGAGTQITASLPLQGRLERRKHDRFDSDRR